MSKRVPKSYLKRTRALQRLVAGEIIYDTGRGWKFGGNKFIPTSVALSLPIELEYKNNKGWMGWKLDRDYIPEDEA